MTGKIDTRRLPHTWNCRVVRHRDAKETWYALHEVHYAKDGTACAMDADPTTFVGGSALEVERALTTALLDVKRRPVFVPPKRWK